MFKITDYDLNFRYDPRIVTWDIIAIHIRTKETITASGYSLKVAIRNLKQELKQRYNETKRAKHFSD